MTDCEASDFQTCIQSAVSTRSAVMGLKESVRAVAQGSSEVVFLAGDVGEAQYKSLVEAICRENKTPLVNVDSKEILGQWCGLAKLDEEGEVVKARSCGVVSIRKIPGGPSGEKLKAFIQASSA
jgi:small subunit ribosomal protein S12e